jgi:hypothetical protein
MKGVLSAAVCVLVLALAGCSKRTAPARIVYVPSVAPPAPTASAAATEALVVAEPQSPEIEPEPAPPIEEPAEKPRPRPRVRLAPPDAALEPEPEPTPAVEVPTLEPREGAAAQRAQRRHVLQFQAQIRSRLTRQEKLGLAADERRMLTDARTFLAQSERALATNDFQRALTLAQKASMLLAVLEQH